MFIRDANLILNSV